MSRPLLAATLLVVTVRAAVPPVIRPLDTVLPTAVCLTLRHLVEPWVTVLRPAATAARRLEPVAIPQEGEPSSRTETSMFSRMSRRSGKHSKDGPRTTLRSSISCARDRTTSGQEIARFYKQSFGRDIVVDVKSALRTNFEDIIVGLLYPLHEYLARELRKAIAGLGTDEDCLIEILCTHSNEDIRLIKDHYQRIFKKDLEKDVIGDTSGDFRRLLVSMCNAQREENIPLDPARARNDASELHQAGVLRWGTDVSAFNRIIATQSYEQLRLVFREYNALANHTVIEAIKSEMSGDLRRAFLAIVKCVYSPPFYFAEKLYNSIKGLGTNDKVLKRVILSRCERDLELIKQEYLDKYKMTLSSAIQSDTSGNYRKALLAIVQGN
ncbi:hypothetical protein MTO96_021014 [Rhipicephalus appendiculatus]